MKSITLAILFCFVSLPTSSWAQEDKVMVEDWLLRQMATGGGIPFTLPTAEVRMRTVYALLSAQGVANQHAAPRARAQQIARFLEKDLDNDGSVTSAELRETLGAQASKPLNSASGVNVTPTKEQIDSILQQLLAKELIADTNSDGTIDFAEMRQYAGEKSLGRRRTNLNLNDPTAIRILDASGDKVVSEAEFIAGIRQAFESVDANKDGSVSREEALPRMLPRFDRTF
jgi:Ca2+-binding EF-hand superfamily protein